MIKPITKDVAGFKKLTGIKVKTAKEITISRIYSILVNHGKDRAWLWFWLDDNGYETNLKRCTDAQVEEVYGRIKEVLSGRGI
jgi:hypothetical protein